MWIVPFVLVVANFCTFPSAWSAPEAAPASPTNTAGGHHVLVLPPKLTVELLSNDSPLPAAEHNGPVIVSHLSDAALNHLEARKYDAVATCDSSAAALAGPCESLSGGSSKLVRGIPSNELKDAMRAIVATGRFDSVLAQFAQLKVGPGGYWDPVFTGAMASNMSSLTLRAALIDCATGDILWKGQAVDRGHESPDVRELRKLEKQLYEKFLDGR